MNKPVGPQAAAFDLAQSEEDAAAAGAKRCSGAGKRFATGTAMGAGVAAASGAVWRFFTGLVTTGSAPLSDAYVNFVTRRLQQQEYEVSGWQ